MRFGLVPDHAKAARPEARAVTIGPPPGLEDHVAFVKAGRPIEFTVIAPQLVPISAQVY